MGLFPQFVDHFDNLDPDRHRDRHGGRLRLRPLPFQGQVGALPRADADAHRAGDRAFVAALHHLARLGIIDTHFALIITYVALNVPFTIWLIDGFFRQVPRDLAEAAQIDGCTRWQAFWQVEFPLAGPGIASSAIFAFLTSWNEFALASQLTRSVNSKTLPVGLLDYTSEFTIDWRGMCALAVVMIAPAFALTFVIQKRLVSGLTFGAVKG